MTQFATASDGLFFLRQPGAAVRIVKTDGKAPDEGGGILFDETISYGIWCSMVLCMSAYGERPNDWHAMVAHHKGTLDLIRSEK